MGHSNECFLQFLPKSNQDNYLAIHVHIFLYLLCPFLPMVWDRGTPMPYFLLSFTWALVLTLNVEVKNKFLHILTFRFLIEEFDVWNEWLNMFTNFKIYIIILAHLLLWWRSGMNMFIDNHIARKNKVELFSFGKVVVVNSILLYCILFMPKMSKFQSWGKNLSLSKKINWWPYFTTSQWHNVYEKNI